MMGEELNTILTDRVCAFETVIAELFKVNLKTSHFQTRACAGIRYTLLASLTS